MLRDLQIDALRRGAVVDEFHLGAVRLVLLALRIPLKVRLELVDVDLAVAIRVDGLRDRREFIIIEMDAAPFQQVLQLRKGGGAGARERDAGRHHDSGRARGLGVSNAAAHLAVLERPVQVVVEQIKERVPALGIVADHGGDRLVQQVDTREIRGARQPLLFLARSRTARRALRPPEAA